MGGLLGGKASDLVEKSERALDAVREGFPCAYFMWHWDIRSSLLLLLKSCTCFVKTFSKELAVGDFSSL